MPGFCRIELRHSVKNNAEQLIAPHFEQKAAVIHTAAFFICGNLIKKYPAKKISGFDK